MKNYFLFFSLFFSSIIYAQEKKERNLFEEGLKLYGEGKVDEGIKMMSSYLNANPEDKDATIKFAEIHLSLENLKEAIKYYNNAIHIDPEDINIRLKLAQLYLWDEDAKNALFQYKEVLKKEPENIELLKKVAEISQWINDEESAISTYEEILKKTPEDKEVLWKLYQLYSWKNRTDKAINFLEKFYSLEPKNENIMSTLAKNYIWAGREIDAINLYEKLIKKNPQNLEYLKNLGNLYEWNGKPKEALSIYERYLEINPGDREIMTRAASLSLDLGYMQSAEKHLKSLLKLDPMNLSLREKLEELSLSTSLEGTAEYDYFSDNLGFSHHKGSLKFSAPLGDTTSIGFLGAYHHFSGMSKLNEEKRKLQGEGFSLSLTQAFPENIRGEAEITMRHYHKEHISFNGGIILTKDFSFPLTISGGFKREDSNTTIDDIYLKIVRNKVFFDLYWEFIKNLFIYLTPSYSYYSDGNNRFSLDAGAGYIIFPSPYYLETIYEYSIEAFSKQGNGEYIPYFSPAHYQTHALILRWAHNISFHFSYALILRPWYSIEDESLLITYGGEIAMRPHKHHIIKGKIIRTDTITGKPAVTYTENVVLGSWTFIF